MKKSYVNMENVRDIQHEVLEQIHKEGICPFCPEHINRFHKKPTIKESNHWLLTENQWPYQNTRVHLLVIYKTHAETLHDIHPHAGQELLELAQWADITYNFEGGALGLRFGNPEKNGATVRHIHAQILTAEITDKNHPSYIPVRFRVG